VAANVILPIGPKRFDGPPSGRRRIAQRPLDLVTAATGRQQRQRHPSQTTPLTNEPETKRFNTVSSPRAAFV